MVIYKLADGGEFMSTHHFHHMVDDRGNLIEGWTNLPIDNNNPRGIETFINENENYGHKWEKPMVCKSGEQALRCINCGWVWKCSQKKPKWECGSRPAERPKSNVHKIPPKLRGLK